VSREDVMQAIRDQGRDRVATLCTWSSGSASFYKDAAPENLQLGLDLDLARVMMAGVLLAIRDEANPRVALGSARIVPGSRFRPKRKEQELGTAPSSLQLLWRIIPTVSTVQQLEDVLLLPNSARVGRTVGRREAYAAITTAKALGWLAWEDAG